MNRIAIACNTANYGGLRGKKVKYIVVHYTAGNGDTARDNGIYFQRNEVGASAHWFVDEREAVLSVPEEFAAWHCGGTAYVVISILYPLKRYIVNFQQTPITARTASIITRDAAASRTYSRDLRGK